MIELTVDEGWTPVPGWEDLYLASRAGRVYSIRKLNRKRLAANRRARRQQAD